jgi:nucleotide-binding universal stress UspA family protein
MTSLAASMAAQGPNPDDGARRYLAAFDRSPEAAGALDAAAGLLAPGQVLVASGWTPTSTLDTLFGAPLLRRIVPAYRDLDAIAAERAAEIAEEGAGRLRDLGMEARAASFEAVDTAQGLIDLAAEHDADAIVIGGRRRAGRHPLLLGSVATPVLHRAHRPVLVVRDGERPPATDGPVMLCYDGSPAARAALPPAGRLLRQRRALLVHAWLPPSRVLLWNPFIEGPGPLAEPAEMLDESSAEAAARLATEGVALAREAGFEPEPVAARSDQSTWRTLVSLAREREVSAIVLGAHGRSPLDVLLGSVAEGVARHAEAPVLVVNEAAGSGG